MAVFLFPGNRLHDPSNIISDIDDRGIDGIEIWFALKVKRAG